MTLLPLGSSHRKGSPASHLSKSQVGVAAACLILSTVLTLGIYSSRGDAAVLNKEDLFRSLTSSPLTDEQKILHVLNRLAFGHRPGDVHRVKAIGVAAYISRQLNPESIDDSAVEERLKPLETVRMTSRDLAEKFPPPGQARRRQPPNRSIEEKKEGAAAERQEIDPEARKAMEGMRKVAMELSQAKILRATYSERQLLEVMTDFWFNHFNVFIGKGADRILTTEYEREVIRPNALGNFHALLAATAKSPAMLFYLDNWMSVDPNAKPPEFLMQARFRRMRSALGEEAAKQALARAKAPRGLNENYARELMELHTLGVDGRYTQKDVSEVARCFTGWTLRNPRQGGGFQFVSFLHDNGEKTVLGVKIPAGGGIKDGEMVLEVLSNDPSTARFVSTKLCRRFVSDIPPESLVKRCADTFLKTKGDIRQVLSTIFTSPEFYSKEAYRAKTKKPFELVVSALRATGVEMSVPPPRLFLSLRTMGEMLYGCQPPTGFADTADAWINTGALLERMNFATALASGKIPGLRIGIEKPEYSDARIADLVPKFAQAILCDVPAKDFVKTVQRQVEMAHSEGNLDSRQRVSTIAALIIGSPEFQRR